MVRVMNGRPWLTVALGAALVGHPGAGRCNGRFPAAQHVVVGPGPASSVVVLRTTFGLLVSRDGGASFRWLCEDAMYSPDVPSGTSDPAVELTADGTIVFAYEYGIHSAPNGCQVFRQASAGMDSVADLAGDPTGRILVGIENHSAGANHVLRAEGGLTFSPLGPGVSGVDFATVEIAPGLSSRVYVSGTVQVTRTPRLYRSDDGGATLTPLAPDFGMGEDAYISGVDPTNPDVLYLRSNVGTGSILLRSHDGGASLQRVAQTRGPMYGFALSDDGATVWIGSPDDGIQRSDDHGQTFVPVNPTATFCLRYHAGVLWQCGDWLRRYALGRSRDGGQTFDAVLQFQDVLGAYDCSSVPSTDGDYCAQMWPAQQLMLELPPDAGRHDAGARDAAATDASAPDAGAPHGMDASVAAVDAGHAPPASTGCGCAVPRGHGAGEGVAVLCAAAGAISRRRRRAPE